MKRVDVQQIDLFSGERPERSDEQARRVIAGALDINVVVHAGAGAGKTHELLRRMVACVRRGVCTVDQLAAITFTRKAAGELKQRFAAEIHGALAEAEGDEAGRLSEALLRVDDCFIGTIHAFCGRLLRERPVEAGLPPDFRELDERDDVAVRDAVWERYIEELYAENGPLLAGLEEVGIRPHELLQFFRIRYDNADLELKPSNASEPSLLEAVETAALMVEESLPFVAPRWENQDGFSRMARKAERMISRGELGDTQQQAEFLMLVESGLGKVTLNRWKDRQAAYRFRDVRGPEVAAVVEEALRRWREFAYTRVAPVADAAVDFYTRYRRRHGLVTFFDLLERTVALLRDRPDVRRHFQRKYQRLFVDEFQDTDPMQAQMLMLLSSTDPTERDWTRARPRPGSIFIVGDEKQSIYRFRRADIETFRAVGEQIERNGGRVVELTASFRTVGILCETLNEVFESVFASDQREYQAEFAPLVSRRPLGLDRVGVRRLDTSDDDESYAEAEAARIADFVASAIEGATGFNRERQGDQDDGSVFATRASPSDFLIVARERANLGLYARALDRVGIPYDISGGDPLGKSDELGMLVDVLSVIERPDDPVLYLKYLRGPLVGASDRELYAWRLAGGSFQYRRPVDDLASDEEHSGIVAARSRLFDAERDLTALPPYSAFFSIIDRLGLAAYAASRDDGTLRAGSLLRVLSYVRQWEAEGKGWIDILAELRGLVRDTVATIEMMTLEVGRPDVVRIMTVHQAKGLQAPVVVLADAGRSQYRGRLEPHVSRVHGRPMLSAAVEVNGRVVAHPEGWAADAEREQRFREAEENRIRYVGATRAQNLLVVCEYKDRGFWKDLSLKLARAPELDRFPVAKPAPPMGSTVPLTGLQSARAARLTAVAAPTISYATPTGEGEDEGRYVPATFGGRGREFGTAVHALLEAVVTKPGTRATAAHARATLRRHDADATEETLAYTTEKLRLFYDSELFGRIERASQVLTEVPVVVREDDTIVSGTIDLVLCCDGRWEIVDYKTDAARDDADVVAIVSAYSSQVLAYRNMWNRTTGIDVARCGLWLFDRGELVPIEADEDTTRSPHQAAIRPGSREAGPR